LVFPDIAVAPAFEQEAPMRIVLDVVVGAVVVDDDVERQEAQSIPATLRASPGLSACVPSPSAWPVKVVWNDPIDEVPVDDVARRISVDDPTEVCTYVTTVPSFSRRPAGTPPKWFDTIPRNEYVPCMLAEV
jgi:hypothetical protein